ncbi:MAG: M48 family metalloprotease [Planctomycetaceae bacterium]
MRFIAGFLWLVLGLMSCSSAIAQDPDAKPSVALPTKEEVEELLRKEPYSLETWETWKGRLLTWISDKSHQLDAAYDAAAEFIVTQKTPEGGLKAPLSEDSLAWYFLGRTHLYSSPVEQPNRSTAWSDAERAYRKSIELDPNFARAHRNLALVLMVQAPDFPPDSPNALEAKEELAKATQLDPELDLKDIAAQAATLKENWQVAESLYYQLWNGDRTNLNYAYNLARSVVVNSNPRAGLRSDVIVLLVKQFPDDGDLVCMYALALAADGEPRQALVQLDRARSLGADPDKILGPEVVAAIKDFAKPTLLERGIVFAIGFILLYALIIASMAACGFVLASWTRGKNAIRLLNDQTAYVVPKGQVVRAEGEPLLAKLYAIALMLGLVMFYVALPFVALGVIIVTLGLLYLVFMLGRIPIKLVVIIVVVGAVMAWAVIKSIFVWAKSGNFGVKKTRQDCPKLFSALDEVAQRVDTLPMTDVYIAPGWEIGVHEVGRGPFGVFGTKARVLTLGLAAMKHLSVDELKSILAHEYAHFSHRDTFFSRFIHRVDVSIDTALGGMVGAGGYLNYVNPFYWFLYLYYRAYSLLSAGYSRSREFLADRMACTLYGANVFHSALRKVSTDGPLFELSMYPTVSGMVAEGNQFTNMYEVFEEFRTADVSASQRAELSKQLEEARGSLFASHPTFRERVDATAAWPNAAQIDSSPAMGLFQDGLALEHELTEYITAVTLLAQQEAAAAAAANTH